MLKASHFLIEVLSWASQKPQGFTYEDFSKRFKLEPWEQGIVDTYFHNAGQNNEQAKFSGGNTLHETIFFVIKAGSLSNFRDSEWKYILTTDALFKNLDHQELEFARENAKEARKFSTIAIIVSLIATAISAFVPWAIAEWGTQDVKIEQSQWSLIEKNLNSIPQE